jgi:cytochrome c biogenesis protein ResB
MRRHTVPLSEHEQQLLAQLEKQLHADDPRFVTNMGSRAVRGASTRNIVLGIVIAVVGLLVLLGGVVIDSILVGVLGFVVMGAGVYVATLRSGKPRPAGEPGKGGPPRRSSPFLQNLEERWDQRNSGGPST